MDRRSGWIDRGRRVAFVASVCAISWLSGGLRGQEPPPPPAPVGEAEADASGGQVLTQGPVHEAFAAPVVHDPKASPVIARQPPDPIREQPPDQKPAGHHVQWIPGYWAWDTTRNDFLWVSGVWREPPPGLQWVPGYWHADDGGFRWVPGSWMPAATPQAEAPETAYLPPPPASLETGPSSPQPSPNTAWTPGYWAWQADGYVWRPGFWAAFRPEWIWMPAHYIWTPSGYVFVPGYWDLPVAGRGLMFAPVYYPQPVYVQPGFVYTPTIAVVGTAVTSNLFVSVGTGQYLFGDYYAPTYAGAGIVPWFSFSVAAGRPVYYDPLFAHYAVVNVRRNPHWVAEVRREYALRRENVALRPPVTYAEQVRVTRNVSITRNINVVDHREMAMPLHRMAASPAAARTVRLERVAEAERRQIHRQAAELHQMREHRMQLERQAMRGGPPDRPRTASLPRSPLASHPMGSHPAGHPGAEANRTAMERRAFEAGGREPSGVHRAERAVVHRPGAGGPLPRSAPERAGHPGAAARGRERQARDRPRQHRPPR